MPEESRPIVNLAAYKFVPLDDLKNRRESLRKICRSLSLKGTILLSREGVNLFVAGTVPAIDTFLEILRREPALSDLQIKKSYSNTQPFRRMLVKIKREIIAFGSEAVDPSKGKKIPATKLKEWLDEGRHLTLLDVRNDYEVRLGTFQNALSLEVGHFREFPEKARLLPEHLKKTPVVMFCTGGIRCEKAGPWLQEQGFDQVHQLEGGILKYFEECGGEHYEGECFIFDQRVALDPDLKETGTTQCFGCLEPLTVKEQQSPFYVPGKSCPYCYRTPEEVRRATIHDREQAIRDCTHPLPGGLPYPNYRPINVPGRCEGMGLLDFLVSVHPHISALEWRRECERGNLLLNRVPLRAWNRPMRAGERVFHQLPGTIEPAVNPDIRILHEDASLVVVDKPAPLPLHPCGRFNRNSLSFILNQVYHPEKLRPAHRLDANTTGVLVLCRTRDVAARTHPQFERGEVEKLYLARVWGSPPEASFQCDVPISRETSEAGGRLPASDGLPARTEFRVLARHGNQALLAVRPLTGRTNQIRVHLWHLGFPIVGDPLYQPDGKLGKQQTLPPEAPPLGLHALQIGLRHPASGQPIRLRASLPDWASEFGVNLKDDDWGPTIGDLGGVLEC